MALSAFDRRLLDVCLAGEAGAWDEFVDRFMGLVLHVADHTVRGQGMSLSAADRDDLAAEVFLALVSDDFRVLRQFRGESSLATYLTVIARRVVCRKLADLHSPPASPPAREHNHHPHAVNSHEQRISDRDELDRLMARLKGSEADVVRMYHLEGKSYREISAKTGVPENSIGSTLSRARSKMRQASSDSAVR